MKTKGILILLGLILFFIKPGFTQKANDPVYVDQISNPDKTMDFTVGVYPNTYYYNASGEYSTLTLKVLNNSTSPLDWNDYKVYILLKDGTLFYNYKTQASSGVLSCYYIVPSGLANSQTVCFNTRFDIYNISKVYLSFSDNKFFELSYVPGS